MDKNILKNIPLAVVYGVIYAVLNLFGWGFGDIPGFFSHPARIIFFAVTLGVTTLTLLLKDLFNVEFLKKGEKENPKEKIIGVVLPSLLTFLMVFIAPYSDSHHFLVMGGGNVLRYFGLAIFLIGYTFMIWGPLRLGKQYSLLITVQKEHKLVTDGPFRFMRHPRYSGVIWWAFGSALIFLSIPTLVLAVLMSALMLLRIPKEERLLHEEFGGEWEEYCERATKKVIPFVY